MSAASAETDARARSGSVRWSRLAAWLRQESNYFRRPVRILRAYRLVDLRPDLIAGLTVAVVLLPQAMAYATIAELPVQVGLYAAIVAAFVGALWGSSRHLHTGPTNAASLLVLSSLLAVAEPGSPEFIAAAGFMAVAVGVIKLGMGLLRMGVLVNFVADSVVVGFTAGAGILIAFNQLRHLLRLDIPSEPALGQTLADLLAEIGHTHWPSLGLGLGVMAAIILIKLLRPGWPAALIGMILAAIAMAALDLEAQGVRVLGALPRGLPPLAHVTFSMELVFKLFAGSLAVAAIGLVEAMSASRSIAAKSGQHLDSNQEFVGQGLASIVAGMFSGYAVSGSFTRTTINHAAGARTSLSSAFSGLWLMLMVLLAAPLAVYLPKTALAAVLLVTAWSMVNRLEIRRILRSSLGDSSIMVATFLATLLLPLEFAVLAGMLVSFARFLIKTSTPQVTVQVPDANFRHFQRVGPADDICPQLGIVQIEGSLYFGAAAHVEETIRRDHEQHPYQHFLLIRMRMVDHCDVSGIHMLESVVNDYRRRGGDVYLTGVRPMVRHMMDLYGFDRVIGEENILTGDDPIGYLFHKVLHPGICIYECKVRVFAECQALPKDDHGADLPDVAEIPEHAVEQLSPSALKLLLADPGTDIQLVDVSENSEFRHWHIAGSRCIPLRNLRDRVDELRGATSICFISRIGRRSTLAAHIMQDLDFERVFSLKGGMLAWEAAGYPIGVE